MRENSKKERDLRIDFFRGLALIFIFIDHVPNNTWALATLRNFGFADASEVFVLLAGYSAGLAYWSINEREGFRAMMSRASRRASEIYLWHLGVFVVSAIVLYSAARAFDNPNFVNHVAISELAKQPAWTLASALVLFYQPNMMNILPLYVALMLWLPIVVALLRRSVALTFALSFGIWLIATWYGLNLPTHQRAEGWFFNPFAWQLLFTTGAAVSVLARRVEARPRIEVALPAAAYVLFAFIVAAPWVPISWLPSEPLLSRDIVGPMSKNDLSAWRFLHVLALAYLVAVMVPKNAPWLKKQWAHVLELCGKNSLEIFSLGTLLSFLGWIALVQLGSSQMTVLAVNVTGIAIMSVTAWQLSKIRSSHPVPQARQAAPVLAA
jgi:hypothetical protein